MRVPASLSRAEEINAGNSWLHQEQAGQREHEPDADDVRNSSREPSSPPGGYGSGEESSTHNMLFPEGWGMAAAGWRSCRVRFCLMRVRTYWRMRFRRLLHMSACFLRARRIGFVVITLIAARAATTARASAANTTASTKAPLIQAPPCLA